MDMENSDPFYHASLNLKENIMASNSPCCPYFIEREGALLACVQGPNQNRKYEQSGCILLQSTIIKTGHPLLTKKAWTLQQAQFYFT